MGVSFEIEFAVYPIFAFVSVILVSIPLYWHLEAWSIGCVLYIFWSGLGCLVQGINAIIWKDNAINSAPVWADIATRVTIAVNVGVPMACLIMIRRLHIILQCSEVFLSRAEKRRHVIIDLVLGLGTPLLQIALYWFIQGHRFDLFEGFGPTTVIPNTYLAWFLNNSWPLEIACVTAVYCGLTLWQFRIRNRTLNELVSENLGITVNRYYRLIALVILNSFVMIPLAAYRLWAVIRGPIYPWRGLSDIHSDFWRVRQIPRLVWQQSPGIQAGFEFDNWLIFSSAIIFFLFFGFAEEARDHYRMVYRSIARRLGVPIASEHNADNRISQGNITTPVFLTHQQHDRRASSSSATSFSSTGTIPNVKDDNEKSTMRENSLDEKTNIPILEFPAPALVKADQAPFSLNLNMSSFFRPLLDVPSSKRTSGYDIV